MTFSCNHEKETNHGGDPIIINSLPYPFEFQLESIEAYNKTIADNYGNDYYHSHTGMRIKMERKSLGLLASKYYYPTATFAILSLISFLIDPDVVSIYLYKYR